MEELKADMRWMAFRVWSFLMLWNLCVSPFIEPHRTPRDVGLACIDITGTALMMWWVLDSCVFKRKDDGTLSE